MKTTTVMMPCLVARDPIVMSKCINIMQSLRSYLHTKELYVISVTVVGFMLNNAVILVL